MRVLASSMVLWSLLVVFAFSAGPRAGIIIGTVVGFGLLFAIFNAVQEICLAKGLVAHRVGTGFDPLLAIAVIVLVVKYVVILIAGRSVAYTGVWDYRLIVMLVALLLLGRVLGLLRNMRKQAAEKSA